MELPCNTIYTGLLYPLGPTLVQYTVHEVVTLRVNITPTANLTRDYLRLLTWYYNGAEIIPASGGSISLRSNNDHTTLTIANISESHSGVYEVKFAGLSIYPHNNCQKETLAMLRHYPVLSPVVFHVYSDGKWRHHCFQLTEYMSNDAHPLTAQSSQALMKRHL